MYVPTGDVQILPTTDQFKQDEGILLPANVIPPTMVRLFGRERARFILIQ